MTALVSTSESESEPDEEEEEEDDEDDETSMFISLLPAVFELVEKGLSTAQSRMLREFECFDNCDSYYASNRRLAQILIERQSTHAFETIQAFFLGLRRVGVHFVSRRGTPKSKLSQQAPSASTNIIFP
jgi:hypothetical protein